MADKKRLKQEEDDQKKRERVNKRLAQLSSQMDDRLFKEACMMREKCIMNLVRGMVKEFSRRRKAAELIVGNTIDRSTTISPFMDTASTVLAPFDKMLPPLYQTYDAEVVRIWDFLHSFSDVFSKSTEPSSFSIPSLDALQDAVVCLKTNRCDKQKSSNAVDLFKGIAIGLCKVISPGCVVCMTVKYSCFVALCMKNPNPHPVISLSTVSQKSYHRRPNWNFLGRTGQKVDHRKMQMYPASQ